MYVGGRPEHVEYFGAAPPQGGAPHGRHDQRADPAVEAAGAEPLPEMEPIRVDDIIDEHSPATRSPPTTPSPP